MKSKLIHLITVALMLITSAAAYAVEPPLTYGLGEGNQWPTNPPVRCYDAYGNPVPCNQVQVASQPGYGMTTTVNTRGLFRPRRVQVSQHNFGLGAPVAMSYVPVQTSYFQPQATVPVQTSVPFFSQQIPTQVQSVQTQSTQPSGPEIVEQEVEVPVQRSVTVMEKRKIYKMLVPVQPVTTFYQLQPTPMSAPVPMSAAPVCCQPTPTAVSYTNPCDPVPTAVSYGANYDCPPGLTNQAGGYATPSYGSGVNVSVGRSGGLLKRWRQRRQRVNAARFCN